MTQPTRRSILQGAAAIATAQFPILGANDRINLGQVGIGGRGRDHLNYYTSLDTDARIAAVCDVNQAGRERGVAQVQKLKNYAPKQFDDMRAMFESKDIDAVSITTPNHWHALSTIWACQAGKDVYCEKPACYNVHEGERMIDVARKTSRMVQIGSQSRSEAYKIKAIQLLNEGIIGKIYLAKGLCFKRRPSIKHADDSPVPPGVNWDMFLGPAPMRPFNALRFKYNWHWFWDTGNGDIGNQGVHEMDICRWGLGEVTMPKSAFSSGGKYVYDDDQETPNTLMSSFDFGGREMIFEVRGIFTGGEGN